MLFSDGHCILPYWWQIQTHLYNVDNVVGKPKHRKGADDHEDEATALLPPLEASASQTAEDGGVAAVDERERQQAAHDGLKEVLEDLVSHTSPVVWYTPSQCGVWFFQITGGEIRDIYIDKYFNNPKINLLYQLYNQSSVITS